MIVELTEKFKPPRILHRDKQISQIKSVFDNFKKFGLGSNLLILGPTGSGKSTSIEKVITEENNSIVGSCLRNSTTFKLFRSIFDIKCNTLDKLLSEVIKVLKNQPKIIIVDEVNKLKDINVFFNVLNAIYRETGCPAIIISNNRQLFDLMPEDARLTLFFEKVEFPQYNSLELYDILKDRLNLLSDKNITIPEGFLRKVCALGGRESSARVVLNLTLRCIYENNFTNDYLDELNKKRTKDDLIDFVSGLNYTEKDFLRNMLDLQNSKSNILPSDIQKKMKNYTSGRISQLITKFDINDRDVEYGVLKCDYLNKGRAGGRLRVVNFISQDVFDILSEIL